MMSWAQAFRRFWWIPTLLSIVLVAGFVYDLVNVGLQWPLVQAYLVMFFVYIGLFYLPLVVFAKYPMQMAYIMLSCFLGVFGLGAAKGYPPAEVIRSFVQARVDLDFFIGFLTVAALFIAIVTIKESKDDETNRPASRA